MEGKEELLADGEYDVILLGTDVKQSVLCMQLQQQGFRCLAIDENDFYGGQSASLRLNDLAKLSGQPPPKDLRSADFSIDLAPKLVLAKGRLIQTLLQSKTADYIDWKQIDGSYVVQKNKLHKVPTTSVEAAKTPLVPMLQKRKLRQFIKTHLEQEESKVDDRLEGKHEQKTCDATESTQQLFESAGLSKETQHFLAHAVALHSGSDYGKVPAQETISMMRVYAKSAVAYGRSPFIYPSYGIGSLAEACSRKAALHGATFMLRTKVDSVQNKDGAVFVSSAGCTAKARLVIADPSYVEAFETDKDILGESCHILRSIFVLEEKPSCLPKGESSAQITLPAHQVKGRKHDIFVTVFASDHCVCPQGTFLAICSTVLEATERAGEDSAFAELDPAVELLLGGAGCLHRFNVLSKAYLSRGAWLSGTPVLFTSSSDASPHFESSMKDIDHILDAAIDILS